MFDHQTAKQILNEGTVKYTDEEVKMITELIYFYSQLTVQTYYDLLEEEKD